MAHQLTNNFLPGLTHAVGKVFWVHLKKDCTGIFVVCVRFYRKDGHINQ